MEPLHSYKDLVVWQKAISLAVATYALTNTFPRNELYSLTSQIRRSAVSIASNIAEGRYRGTRKDFLQFLRIAYASGAELETQLSIAQKVTTIPNEKYTEVNSLLNEAMCMLNVIIRRLNKPASQ
ncbi:four helix bundle protein [Candidatus Campbellbacteria bacterium]|nr:MAG: four helix bundle protein [Candidatus Campbellbacteria bacterium]